jgi:hypothetical protein
MKQNGDAKLLVSEVGKSADTRPEFDCVPKRTSTLKNPLPPSNLRTFGRHPFSRCRGWLVPVVGVRPFVRRQYFRQVPWRNLSASRGRCVVSAPSQSFSDIRICKAHDGPDLSRLAGEELDERKPPTGRRLRILMLSRLSAMTFSNLLVSSVL